MPCDACNFCRRHEKEYSAWIDEAANEPRTSNANDLRPPSRYPDGPAVFVPLGNPSVLNQELALRPPDLVSTTERLSIDPFVSEGSRGGLAERTAVLANDHACLADVSLAPARHILRTIAPGRGNEAGICPVVAIRAHVDKSW